MSLHSDTLSWFRANHYLLLLLIIPCLTEIGLWFDPTRARTHDLSHRHSNSGPPFFLIWSLPRLWYGSLSGSISLNHLSIFYNISCCNSLVLLTFVSRSSCRITYIYIIHKGMKQSSKYKEGILASTRYSTITRQFKKGPSLVLVSKMISLHTYLVYTYEQQIFIDEIQVYSRRHIQLSSTRAHSGGQPNIFCFALFHWSERFS